MFMLDSLLALQNHFVELNAMMLSLLAMGFHSFLAMFGAPIVQKTLKIMLKKQKNA